MGFPRGWLSEDGEMRSQRSGEGYSTSPGMWKDLGSSSLGNKHLGSHVLVKHRHKVEIGDFRHMVG